MIGSFQPVGGRHPRVCLLQGKSATGDRGVSATGDGPEPHGSCLNLAEVPAALLVRLRSDRCFYADPPPSSPTASAVAGPAINAFRQSLVDGSPIPAPAPNQDCPDVDGFFGNSDIFGGTYADPTTP